MRCADKQLFLLKKEGNWCLKINPLVATVRLYVLMHLSAQICAAHLDLLGFMELLEAAWRGPAAGAGAVLLLPEHLAGLPRGRPMLRALLGQTREMAALGCDVAPLLGGTTPGTWGEAGNFCLYIPQFDLAYGEP